VSKSKSGTGSVSASLAWDTSTAVGFLVLAALGVLVALRLGFPTP